MGDRLGESNGDSEQTLYAVIDFCNNILLSSSFFPLGLRFQCDDNAAVIIDKNGLPRGTRILGPIAREVREAGYTKIASLSKEVV